MIRRTRTISAALPIALVLAGVTLIPALAQDAAPTTAAPAQGPAEISSSEATQPAPGNAETEIRKSCEAAATEGRLVEKEKYIAWCVAESKVIMESRAKQADQGASPTTAAASDPNTISIEVRKSCEAAAILGRYYDKDKYIGWCEAENKAAMEARSRQVDPSTLAVPDAARVAAEARQSCQAVATLERYSETDKYLAWCEAESTAAMESQAPETSAETGTHEATDVYGRPVVPVLPPAPPGYVWGTLPTGDFRLWRRPPIPPPPGSPAANRGGMPRGTPVPRGYSIPAGAGEAGAPPRGFVAPPMPGPPPSPGPGSR
jgi:hypothetical protein